MENIRDKIKKDEYRNWVKSTLGLEQTKKAVQEYVKEKFSTYLKGTCRLKHYQSFFTDDELQHIEVGGSLRTNLKKSVSFKNSVWIWSSADNCSGTNFCKTSFEKITQLHRKYLPGKGLTDQKMNWENSNTSLNTSLEWAIAKMFMPQGNEDNKEPADTDPYAIFHVMSVCDLFTNAIKLPTLKKLKEARNELCHSKDNTVKSKEVKPYFQHMKLLLKFAANDTEVREDIRKRIKEDIGKLKKLKSSEMTVSMFDDALRIKRKQIYSEFEKKVLKNEPEQLMELLRLAEKTMEDIQEVNKYSEYIDELKNIEGYKLKIRTLTEQLDNFKLKMNATDAEDFIILIVIIVAFAVIIRVCVWSTY